MQNKIIVLAIAVLILVMMSFIGCSKSTNGDDNNNDNPPDTTETPDTTQPDSTGFGTLELVNTVVIDDAPSYFAFGDNILVSASSYRIRFFSLASQESPEEIGIYPTDYPYTNMIKSIVVHDTLLFFTLDYPSRKIMILNITDPTSILLVGEIELVSTPQCIAYGDNMVFVGYGSSVNGSIIDVSNPATPAISGTILAKFGACDYFNHKLYCVNTDDMVYSVDIISQDSAYVEQSANTGGENLDVAVTPWGHLYIARGVQTGTNTGAFIAYDVNQLGLEQYSEQMNGWAVKNVDFENNFVYLLSRPAGGGAPMNYDLRIYFAYNLEQVQLAFEDTVIYGNCLGADNRYLYVGARSSTGEGGNIFVYHHEY
ncbi:hypothetical protein J7L68_00585 [bacterium]|nr:hypothetical protein [bacterium]